MHPKALHFRPIFYTFLVKTAIGPMEQRVLIQFSVANFRSIRERQTLRMTAGSSSAVRKTKSIETKFRGAPYLLRSAAIYGANGSGKTSLIKAVAFFRRFVLRSLNEREPGEPHRGLSPYIFSKKTAKEPSEFEIAFISNNSIYQYGFIVDQDRVWSEWLFQTQRGVKTLNIIDRRYDAKTGNYTIDLHQSLTGAKSAWRTSTRPDALFLTTAVSLNSAELKIPYEWIRNQLRVIEKGENVGPSFTSKLHNEGKDERVMNFIKNIGLEVKGIVSEESSITDVRPPKGVPPEVANFVIQNIGKKHLTDFYCVHKDEDGDDVLLPFEEESDGTQVLVSLAGPWLDIADNGITLFVDELHNSLHPFAMRYLIENFFTNKIGEKGGQLIFTTHDTYAMSDISLHRDQIWFVEKDIKAGTQLVPLSDYSVRSGEPYRTGYIKGRYGGVPILRHSPLKIADRDDVVELQEED